MSKIKLNDILRLDDIENTKIRFLTGRDDYGWDPLGAFKDNDLENLYSGMYWNYTNKSFQEGQTALGFARIESDGDLWLLFHVGKVTKDLNIFKSGPAYEYETLAKYEKYFGRLIIKYHNQSQQMIRIANTVIDECEVYKILPNIFDNDIFPGYDKVDLSWKELSRVMEKETWKTALKNQKGVYLITDTSNGKNYVGSAYGDNMILGRWESYVKTGHGGNKELKTLNFEYIKNNFRYSILDIYKSTIEDKIIIERENWWKTILQSRQFGYNSN